jgi:hypothetical protein
VGRTIVVVLLLVRSLIRTRIRQSPAYPHEKGAPSVRSIKHKSPCPLTHRS